MSALYLVILATIFFARLQISNKLAGGKIDGFLIPGIASGASIVAALSIYIWYQLSGANLLPTSRFALVLTLLAGVSIAGLVTSFAKFFQKGGNPAFTAPLIFAGAI